MSETIMDEIPSSNGLVTTETNSLVKESGEDEETWLYGKQKAEENMDNTATPSIDDVTTQEMDEREKTTIPLTSNPPTSSLIGSQLDDDSDDDDDGIQVTIGNIKAGASIFPPNRQNSRTSIPAGPVIPPKPQATRGIDLDAQGMINGQPTYEHDLMNAYKDDNEKPWKKPGADISDYFNYGFTEETWAQYCDRQRRLRAENNLARLNATHMPQMPPMMPGHPPIIHPMNPHPGMMMNKPPINMPMMPRPFMNVRKQDGKIDVIGATDQTSRRQMFEAANNFEHPQFHNGPQFAGNQPPNGQTVGDLVSTPPASNGPPPGHGTPPGPNHPIPTLGGHRMPMMPPPPGMQFRPPFGHPHAPGGGPFFPHGPGGAMHGERPPQPYFMPRHPQQPWENRPGAPPVHGFPPGHFPPQAPAPNNTGNNGRPPSSRSPTPEDHSSRSSTPEENRPSGTGGDNEKSSKDDRYKERYRDDREHYSSSRRRSSPKDRGSSSYRSRHRSGDHEYERPRGDRKSSRDRDEKYERYSRKRHHREDSGRHHRGDDDSSRGHRSSRRTPTKNFSSPPKTLTSNNSQLSSTDSPQIPSENLESTDNEPSSNMITSTTNPMIPSSSSSPTSRSRREDSERSSSRHGHHKKSSKRSRRDSDDERSHRRRSKDKSSSSKKSSNSTEISSDVKEQSNE